jgi:hypothetical protein
VRVNIRWFILAFVLMGFLVTTLGCGSTTPDDDAGEVEGVEEEVEEEMEGPGDEEAGGPGEEAPPAVRLRRGSIEGAINLLLLD